VVAFGAHADVVQAPTTRREDVFAALDRLELQRFTGIGNGLMGALLTLVPAAEIPQGIDIFGAGRTPPGYERTLAQPSGTRPGSNALAPGSYLSEAIVLVSDGRGTIGVPPVQAARIAARLGIRVFTIGVGTLYGGGVYVEGWPTIHAEFDEEILKDIADVTHGEYFLARNADKVTRIYGQLARRVVLERTEHEITPLVAALGFILAMAAAGLALWRSGHMALR
jgi:Ca-activated chloride channel family protein